MIGIAMSRVDAEASRNFSLYLEDARRNGYGFQAYLVEKKAIPQIEQALNDITKAIQEFRSLVPEDVQKLAPGRWEWRRMAKEASLLHEHDYIYSCASKLLACDPSIFDHRPKKLGIFRALHLFALYLCEDPRDHGVGTVAS
jgi:hypothetical protein